MPPPRKLSTLQQDGHPSKLVDDESDGEARTDCVDMGNEAEDTELDASQGTMFQKVILQGLNDQKKRHAINKKNVVADYDSAKTKLQDNINSLFDEYEDQSDTAHRAQLTRLADLLAQKASLESQMASKLARLRASYDARSKELIAVVDTRIKELK